jgi:hypothetical protein
MLPPKMYWFWISLTQAKSLVSFHDSSINKIPFRYQSRAIQPGAIQGDNLASTLIGTIGVGTPPQPMSVLFDTGSRLFWVRSSRCTSLECIDKQTYDSQKSTTFVPLSVPESNRTIRYADGTTISCTTHSDQLSLGSYVVENQNFCEATEIRTDVASTDGVIGLGPPKSISSGADVFVNIINQTTLPQSIISFWYNRNQTLEGSGDAGEIILGRLDQSKFKEPIYYTSLTSDRSYWNVELQSIQVGSTPILNSTMSSMIDTGTTLVLLPNATFALITAHMPVRKIENYYYIDCKKVRDLPPLNFTFVGMPPLTLTWDQQVLIDVDQSSCLLIFQPERRRTSNLGTIFGALFLRQFYTIFDYDQERVGFALHISNVTTKVPGNSASGFSLYWITVFLLLPLLF